MEQRVEELEKELGQMREYIKIVKRDQQVIIDFTAQACFWFGNVVDSLSKKGILSEEDIKTIEDIQKPLEQFRENARREILFKEADEEKPH